MKTMHRAAASVLLASLGAAASLAWPASAAAQATPTENTVVAVAVGTVGSEAASEPVVFAGQASITGKVIYDTVFGAPPVLQLIVDLSQVTGRGQRTGTAYRVAGQAILHRPLQAFDVIDLSFSFGPAGDFALSRSALASFGVYYNATSGVSTTPMTISTLPPA
ncbi:MAG TPA: hypothetical protein VFM98_13525 [Ramlibacter sp.]|uniref:hypothetical protein n=1 Tax=Ramlibacter sp. TaxID=1917967 RepID=UPI002D7E96CF|nr:hypothetical protein [Ramlibacter sp.]HET8746621.1 hypothetical protein [Ramlibacter sp.]